MLLGCIGDDFTGSSDLANTLSKNGMRTVQYTGVPSTSSSPDVEAGVIALKTRSIPSSEAVSQSLLALEWLIKQGCKQFFFKYCSTFDSTKDGNIGPVIDALADALETDVVIVCPAFPGAGRSLYQGHLFVNDVLLNESGMENHPITPMTDPDIRRFLQLQSVNTVGHVNAETVLSGSDKIKSAIKSECIAGKKIVVVDALRDIDLIEIGAAVADIKLITGGSGIALGLPKNFEDVIFQSHKKKWRGETGKCVALSGSCSKATRGQIIEHAKSNPIYEIDASKVLNKTLDSSDLVEWALSMDGIPLIYSSAEPSLVNKIQDEYGKANSAKALESFFSEIASQLIDRGIKKLLTAGGETSGAVVEGLKLDVLEIGPEINPGIPALRASDNLVIALKSGNFGTPDFFSRAAKMLGDTYD